MRIIRVLSYVCLVTSVGCADDGPGAPIVPDDDGKVGNEEQPKSGALAIDEAGIRTRVVDGQLVVTLPVTTLAGVGRTATLTAKLTPLASEAGASGTTTFVLSGGQRMVDVTLPDAALPPTQGAQAGWLVRYDAVVDGERAFGQRSLYHTLPKYGMTLWTPSRLDAGATTAVRVWLRDLETGTLLAGIPVTVAGQKGTTDVAGQVAVNVTAPAEGSSMTVEARAEPDGLPVTSSTKVDIVSPGAPRVLVSTDKPLYRPGQVIHARVLALAAKDLAPLAGAAVTIEVLDGKENKVFKEATTTDAFGVASLTAPLARQVNLGTYRVRAIASDVTAERAVEVSEEKLPKFAVTVATDDAWYEPGEAVSGLVKARYFFGKAVVGGTVTVDSGFAKVTGATDAEGLFPFELPGGSSSFPIAVEVVDTAGFAVSSATAVQVAAAKLHVAITPESGMLPGNGPFQAFVTTRGPLGEPVDATCTGPGITAQTGKDGVATITLQVQQVMIACTGAGLGGAATQWFNLVNGVPVLLVRADKAIYGPGEKVALTVIAEGTPDTVYLDRVHRGRIVESLAVPLVAGTGTAEMTPGPGETGTLVFTGYVATDTMVASAERVVYVRKPSAQVGLTLDQPTYLPGGEAHLTLEVTDEHGKGKAAAVGVTIADEAVFALAGSQGPSDVAGFFLLEDAPAGIRGQAQSQAPAQEPAMAALAAVGSDAPAHQSGIELAQVHSDAWSAYQPAMSAASSALYQSLDEAATSGKITKENAEATIEAIEIHDFWGQPWGIDVDVWDQHWNGGVEIYVKVASRGPDELDGTWDDWTTALYLSVYEGRGWPAPAPGGAPADAASSADWGASGGDGADGFDGTDGADATDGVSEPEDDGQAKPRTEFPETLYVNPAVITDGTGKAQIVVPLADAITEWRVSMIANTADGRVGGGTGGITVFQDFFVDTDLPKALTQNDELALPIGVFNFSDLPQDVTVTVKTAPWFSLTGPAEKSVSIGAGQSLAVPFDVKVLQAGVHELQVSAASATFSDAVARTVKVVPDGQRFEESLSGHLEGTATATLAFPSDAIAGGTGAFLKLMGAPAAQMVDGVEALLSAPTGCFEPMMNATWINALVLDYLDTTGTVSPALAEQAKANLNSGVQQCLTFECTGGGFTWFGNPDPAHPILTALALVMVHDIREVASLDEAMVSRAQTWLAGKQGFNGGWFTLEGTKNEVMPWDELRTTCVATWGLAASGYTQGDTLVKGVEYVKAAMDLEADTYTLAMCANALVTAAPNDAQTAAVISELLDRVDEKDGRAFWASDYPGVTFAGGDVIAVETTALAAQALYQLEAPPPVLEGVLKYLASQKSPDGNFLSTQGTIQALRAFLAAAKLSTKATNADVTVTAGGKTVLSMHIDDTNRDVVNFVDLGGALGGAATDVTLTAKGEGKLYWQIASAHYRPWSAAGRRVGPVMDLVVDWSTTTLSVGQSLTATLTVLSNGLGVGPGDMPMVELGIPPGFDADLAPLDEKVANDPLVARYERKGDRVVIYLHDIPGEAGKVFEVGIPMSPRYPMTVTTPLSKAWPFYRPDQTSEALPVVLTVN